MKKNTKLMLTLALCVLGVGSVNADDDLIEIPQDQGVGLDGFARTEFVAGEDYNTYTCTEGIQVAFKMFDIDVAGCDYVVVKFAEPVAAGWELAFWGKNDQSTVAIPAGATEYKYVFAEDESCAIANDILPQVTMLHLWTGSTPLVAKISGIYKHISSNDLSVTYKLYYGGSLVASQAAEASSGNAAAVPAALKNPFCTYSYSPSTITESGDITVTVTWNGPIPIASDYASINWKNLYLNRSKKWYLNNSTSPCLVDDPFNSDRAADSYLWGLVGNPYSYKIYNKAAGSTKTLNGSAAMADGEYSWTKMAKNGDGILFGRSDGQYLNQAGGDGNTGLGFWGDNKDAGSTFFVADVITEPVAPLADGELIPDFFSICAEGAIPYGYDVKFGSENRAYPNTYGSGARMFAFKAGGDFTKAIYFREGYVRYGNEKALTLEAGKNYIVCFNSAMWKSNGATLTFSIFKKGDLANAVFTKTINNTPDVNGSKDAVTGSTRSEINFTPEADGYYILEWNTDGYKEVLLANVAVKIAPTDPLASYKQALTEKINQGNAQNSFAKTADSFGALTTAISDGEDELANPSATQESLENAAQAITDAIAGLKLADGYVNLSTDMYHEWSGIADDATIVGNGSRSLVLNTDQGQGSLVYGDVNVNWKQYAKIVNAKNIVILGTSGLAFGARTDRTENNESLTQLDVTLDSDGKGIIDISSKSVVRVNAIKRNYDGKTGLTTDLLIEYKPRTVSVSSALYTTFAPDLNVKAADVTAYAAKYEGGKIVLTEVAAIPAGKGAIIKASAEDTYSLPVVNEAASIDADNELLVSDGTVTGDGSTVFALAKKNDVVGFYLVASTVTIPAGKAYMVIPDAAREFIGFADDEVVTGIKAIETVKADKKIFNLNGQRMAQPKKGLNIIGGKKVLK